MFEDKRCGVGAASGSGLMKTLNNNIILDKTAYKKTTSTHVFKHVLYIRNQRMYVVNNSLALAFTLSKVGEVLYYAKVFVSKYTNVTEEGPKEISVSMIS